MGAYGGNYGANFAGVNTAISDEKNLLNESIDELIENSSEISERSIEYWKSIENFFQEIYLQLNELPDIVIPYVIDFVELLLL